MTKITFVMGQMDMGGAERVAVTLIHEFVKLYDEVSLINMSHLERDYFSLPDQVKHIHLNLEREAPHYLDTFLNVLNRIRQVRTVLIEENPDIVISFTDRTNVITLSAVQNLKLPVIVSIHTHPFQLGPGLKTLCRMLYPRANAVHSVSNGVASAYSYITREHYVIPNPLSNLDDLDSIVPEYLDPKFQHILSLGRLSPEKGYPLLIEAFALISKDFPNWRVSIFGEGDQRSELEAHIAEKQITDRFFLPGSITNPYAALKAADIFVQPSHREGFSVALLEAMACGLPCIVTDHSGNPREVITPDVNGIIIPLNDPDAIASALRKLMQSKDERGRLGQSARYVRETYSPVNIIKQWQDLIDNLLSTQH